eukprot:229980_1
MNEKKISTQQRKRLVVHGYIKKITEQISKPIPSDIEQIIFKFYDIKLDSKLLEETDIHYIYDILPDVSDIHDFKLLLRATDDGFDKETFHKVCDFKSPILSIVISAEGDIFGGYSKLQWSQSEKWRSDPQLESFIFVLKASEKNISAKNHKPPFKWFVKKDSFERAVYDYHDGFGYGLDWFVGWNANEKSKRANQRLGHSYGFLSKYAFTMHFNKLVDYEIWQIIQK